MTVKVLSLNVRVWTRDRNKNDSFYWKRRMEAVRQCIVDNDPDILFLQELMPPATRYIPKQYRKVGVSLHHSIYAKKGWKKRRHRWHMHYEVADVSKDGRGIRLINVHLSLDGEKRARDLSRINGQIENRDNYLLGGDFNTDGAYLAIRSNASKIGPNTITFANHIGAGVGAIDHFLSRSGEGEVTLLGKIAPLGFTYNGNPISDHAPIICITKI